MNIRVIAQAKAKATSVPPVHSNLLQRKCACGGTPGPTGECEECRKKRLQRKVAQPSILTPQHSQVLPVVHEVLRSPGKPLDRETRAFMEPRFGHDFSHVRVHTDDKAAESARAVSALAYAVGRDLVFAHGHYAPGTKEGRRLLAHELAHVTQQDTSDQPRDLQVDTGGEREAEAVADSALSPRFSVRGCAFRLRQNALARQEAGVERSQELHFMHVLHGAAEPQFEARPECLKSFTVFPGHPVFNRVDTRHCGFEAPFEVQADFDPRCKCSELEYRQFIRGHVIRDPDRKPEHREIDLFPDLPLGLLLSEVYQEDGNTKMTPVHYGHRDEPAGSSPKAKSQVHRHAGEDRPKTGLPL